MTGVVRMLCVLTATAIATLPVDVVAEDAVATSTPPRAAARGANQSSGNMTRPKRPPRVPDPREFSLSLDEHGRVPPFHFIGQAWPDVLQWLATLSDRNLDWQSLPNDYLNLSTERSLSVDELRDLVNRHLTARGHTLLERDGVLSVFAIDALDPSLVPRVSEEELYHRGRYDHVKVTFELPPGVPASDFAADARQVLGPHATVIPLTSSNRLLAIDAAANLRNLAELLTAERAAADEGFREFVLRHARGEQVLATLQDILGIGGGSSSKDSDAEEERLRLLRGMQQQGADVGRMLNVGDKAVRLAFNRRRNSILVNAPPESMRIIQRAIQAMDVPAESLVVFDDASRPQGGKFVKKYSLRTAAIETMLQMLNDVGGLSPGAEVRGDPTMRSLIVLANEADHSRVAALIEQLDGGGRRLEVVPLRRLAADAVAVTVYHLMVGAAPRGEPQRDSAKKQPAVVPAPRPESSFRVDADVENNRLLLWANDVELDQVRNLLAQLGEVPGQQDGGQTVRVLGPFQHTPPQRILQQIQGVWSSFSDQPLIINAPSADATGAERSSPSNGGADDEDSAEADPTDEADLHTQRNSATPRRDARGPGVAPMQFADLRMASRDSDSSDALRATVTDDGRVILDSSDIEALDAFEKLLKVYSPPEPRFRVFRLQHASAFSVWLNLTEYFDDQLEKQGIAPAAQANAPEVSLRLSRARVGLAERRKLQIIYDTPSNSILVANASATQLAEIKQILDEYDRPAPAKSIKSRRTAAIKVHQSSAAAIATALKEVYRDLLSSRDKEFESEDKKLIGTASEAPTIIRYGQSDSPLAGEKSTDPIKVRFDGSLSIGVDDASNMLVISAQEELFESIVDTIRQLDEAVPRQAVAVHALRGNISPRAMSNALAAALQSPGAVRESERKSQPSAPGSSQATTKSQVTRPRSQPKPSPTRDTAKPATTPLIGRPAGAANSL